MGRSSDGGRISLGAITALGHPPALGLRRLVLAAVAAGAVLAAAAPGALAVQIKGWKSPTASRYTNDLTAGPGGAMWLTAQRPFGTSGQVVRVTLNGKRRAFPLPKDVEAGEIARGPGDVLWLVVSSSGQPSIGQFTTDGELTIIPLPGKPWRVSGLTPGPDGAMWFVEVFTDDREVVRERKIGRIARDGTVSEFFVARGSGGGAEDSMTRGPDGAMWFTDNTAGKLGRISMGGKVRRFALKGIRPRGCGDCQPRSLIAGPGRALWFSLGSGDRIVRRSAAGGLRVYRIPMWGSRPTYLRTIARGPDDAIWFTTGSSVGRLSSGGAVRFWPFPAQVGVGAGGALTNGPHHTLWWGSSQGVGRISGF